MYQFRFQEIKFVISLSFCVKSTLPRYNSTLSRTRGKLKYNCKNEIQIYTHINIYLNVNCILTFQSF